YIPPSRSGWASRIAAIIEREAAMFALKRIVAPVDFSQRSIGAVRYAEALAERFGAEVILLHVLPPPHYEFSSMEVGGSVLTELFEARTAQVKAELEAFAREELPRLKAQRVLLEGDPARRIVQYAHEEKADLVVVSFHWRGEGLNYPREYQRRLGRLAIELGACLVLGHHPHVLQGFEVYRGGLIAYSLGNFAFGSYSARAKDSAILLVELDRAGPRTAWVYPVNVYNREVAFQTRLRTGVDAARVLAEIQRYSAPFGLTLRHEGDCGIISIRP
ncbi:MAG: CapA family protein, partial [Firmicutes bacterium]|nr:CapA family protein [Bacillota bacterium]